MSTRALTAMVVVAGLALALGRADAQPVRPAIPEPRCTEVTLVAEPGAGGDPRRVGLRVRNTDRGDFPAHLRGRVEVEEEVGGRWRTVSVAGLELRASCRGSAPDCVTIEPRSDLSIVPWTGMLGDAQCVCTRCFPAPAGRYRFAVTTCQSCQSPIRAVSAPFELPAPPA